MVDKPIVVGLDLGNKNTRVMVAEGEGDNTFRICGWSKRKSAGVHNGRIVNVEEARKTIKSAVEHAEIKAGRTIRAFKVALGGLDMVSMNCTGGAPSTGKNNEINRRDIDQALETAMAVPIPPDRDVIQVFVRGYQIDGNDYNKYPLAAIGSRVDAHVHIVTASAAEVLTINKAVESVGYSILDRVPGIMSSAAAVLTQSELLNGTLLINIGKVKTEYVVIHGDCPWNTGSIPIGGMLVTTDIADKLNTSIQEAERIKMEHGTCIEEDVLPGDQVIVANYSGNECSTVLSAEIAGVIGARMRELFEIIKDSTNMEKFELKGGVVLTGGGSLLRCAGELAKRIFNIPVRVGGPRPFMMIQDECRGPEWSTVAGLLKQGMGEIAVPDQAKTAIQPGLGRMANDFIQWLRKVF